MARRGLIMRVRLAGAAGGLRGAALPVFGAGERGRMGDACADAREMLVGGVRVVEEAQRDPARGELLLGAIVLLGGRHGFGRDAVGGRGIAGIEQPARDQAPLVPPFVAD